MSQVLVSVVAQNPNDQVGGGGCLCSETKVPECRGPFALFTSVEMESSISPYAVACRRCLEGALEKLHGEVLTPTTDRITTEGSE